MAHLCEKRLIDESSHQFLIQNGFRNQSSASRYCEYSTSVRTGHFGCFFDSITLYLNNQDIVDSHKVLFQKIYTTGVNDGKRKEKAENKKKVKDACLEIIDELFDDPQDESKETIFC